MCNVNRECYAEIEHVSSKTGKTYKTWEFMGWYPPTGTFLKSTKDFNYYQGADGRYKYRKVKEG